MVYLEAFCVCNLYFEYCDSDSGGGE